MKVKGKVIRRFMSIMLCIALFARVFVVPGPTNVGADGEGGELEFPPPPDEDEPTPPKIEEYNIYLSNISICSVSMYPEIIFVNTLTYINFTFSNKGEKYITDVMAEVCEVRYHYIEPEEGNLTSEPYTATENYLTTLSYGDFPPMYGKTETVSWVPAHIGEYEIKLNISYNEASLNVAYEEGITFIVWRNDLQIIEMNEDWIIDENVSMDNVTIILDGDIVVNEGGNLTLQDGYLIADNIDIYGEIWNENFDIDISCDRRGEYHVWIHKTPQQTGILHVVGSTIYNNPPQNTYHFWVDGILDCREKVFTYPWHPDIAMGWIKRSAIMHVWGQDYPNGTETGGIELRNTNPAEQSTFRWTLIRDCDTIGIGCYGSSPTIYPFVTIYYCGSEDWGYGKGVYAEGTTADPLIQSSWIRYNHIYYLGHGIKLKNGASATILNNYIDRNNWAGVYCYNSSSGVTIQSNWRIYNNRFYGILCWYSSPTIENNPRIELNRYGIRCYKGSPIIKENTISENCYGILCYRTPSPIVDGHNTITSNSYLGIFLCHSSPTIQNNDISCNSYTIQTHNFGGIYGYYSSPTIKYNNIISNYGWGIKMFCGAPTNADTIGIDNTYGLPENTMGRVWQQWRLKVRTADADGGFIRGAYVEVYNQTSSTTPVWTGMSGVQGYTFFNTVTQYKIPNSQTSKDYYTPHTIRAEKDVTDYTYTAEKLETIDDNKVVEINFDFSRFAILAAPCRTPAEQQAFKGDISKMRNYFINKGWLDSNMWFLTNGSESYVDGDATYDNVVTALDDIKNRSTDQDIVYIQYVDHGGSYRDAYDDDSYWGGRIDGSTGDLHYNDESDDSYCSNRGGGDSRDPSGNEYDGALSTKGQYFYDDEFAAELNEIVYRFLVLANCACFSAEFIEDCSNDFKAAGRIINTAAPENDFSYWNESYYTYYAYYFHEGLTWTSALGTHNPDTWYTVSNNNGRIEIEEAHAYAFEYDTWDEPKIWDWKTSTNLYLP